MPSMNGQQNPKKPKSKLEFNRKKDGIPADVRTAVWNKYNGGGTVGFCYACGTEVQRYNAGWHCSHVIARDKDGPATIDNLRCCCKHCNLSMGDQNMYAYIQQKRLKGQGAKNAKSYFERHPSQINSKRSNNWGK